MSFDRNHSDALFIQALDRLGNLRRNGGWTVRTMRR